MNKIYGPDKWKVHYEVQKAVKKGKLIKPKECSKCGSNSRIQGHHEDYSKPLGVVWLCIKCHRQIHRKTPSYLNLPKVGILTKDERILNCRESQMDDYVMEKYIDCTYDVAEVFDLVRNNIKITVKFYDNRGFVVWKEIYYKN